MPNIYFYECVSEHHSTKSMNLNAVSHTAGGFYAVLSSFLAFNKCKSFDISSEVDDTHGFPIFICPTAIELFECHAELIKSGFNKSTETGAKATGFEIDITDNAVLTKCYATWKKLNS